MKILTLDCETYDPSLLTYGQGWAFKYNFPEIDFEVLGFGYRTSDGILDYTDNWEELLKIINNHDAILCHNAIYDIGALICLYRDKLQLNNIIIIDTVIEAKLVNQHHMSYSLDSLTEHYKLVRKESDILHNYAWLSGMYQQDHLKATGRNCHTRPSEAILNRYCMADMRKFPAKVVGEYCLKDIEATWSLHVELSKKLEQYDYARYSDLIKVCLDIKTRGVCIDLTKAKELSIRFKAIAVEAEKEVISALAVTSEFNINSTKQLGEALISQGYKLPVTESGNPSLRSEWLEEQEDPIFKLIKRYRKALKVEKDFIQKLTAYQEIIPDKYKEEGRGWLFPSLKPLGATMTGRFTSGGGTGSLELSIHQIPRRDEEFGSPIRELFIAHKGERLVCCDFSSQESRLQVHYAKLLNCKGVQPIVDAWNADPIMKYHHKVAEMTGLEYDIAKMINLGLSYGMHAKTMSEKLGMSFEQGEAVIKQYHKLLPFMSQLQSIASKNMAKLGYIRTIGGRKLYIDPPYSYGGKIRTNESKALSKLIQGSASDQCITSMINAWKAGLKILFSVHDEIVISTDRPNSDLIELTNCMQNSYLLEIPMVAEGGIGDSWGEAK